MPFHLDKEVLYAGFTYFFSILCCKSIDLKAFHAFGRISFRLRVFFLWNVVSKKYWFEVFSSFWSSFLSVAFSLKFLVLANFSGQFAHLNWCYSSILSHAIDWHVGLWDCSPPGPGWLEFAWLLNIPLSRCICPQTKSSFVELWSFQMFQNLEWGPLDSTHATFAVVTCWTKRTWNAGTPPSKGALCRLCIFLFNIFWKSIDLKTFHAFGRTSFRCLVFSFETFYRKSIGLKCFQAFGLPFCWLPFPWSS